MEVKTNLGRVSLVPRGVYDLSAVYQRLDIVQYDGSSYLVLKNEITGIVPDDGTDYMLLAVKGNQGDIGPQGIQGPQGAQGPKGGKGDRGDPGSSIASIDRTSGNGAAGTVDTYTITLTDGSTTTFKVRNGADGDGAGDMTRAVYDPQGKAKDIFHYVDEAMARGGSWDAEGTAQRLVDEHNTDPEAHKEQFAALEEALPDAISLDEIDALMGVETQQGGNTNV